MKQQIFQSYIDLLYLCYDVVFGKINRMSCLISEILRIFRDEKPPQFSGTSAQALTASRWVPPSTLKRDANHDDRNDFTFRRVRGLVYIHLYYIAHFLRGSAYTFVSI